MIKQDFWPIAGQKVGLSELKFFVDTQEWPGVLLIAANIFFISSNFFSPWQCRALELVIYKLLQISIY